MSAPKLRIARPTDHLKAVADMYIRGLGFERLGNFDDHDGFDGIMVGHPLALYHLEFTQKRGHPADGAPSEDGLLVFYIPDSKEWQEDCQRMEKAGFVPVPAFNPYWDQRGRTFRDVDGYRVVLQNAEWAG